MTYNIYTFVLKYHVNLSYLIQLNFYSNERLDNMSEIFDMTL